MINDDELSVNEVFYALMDPSNRVSEVDVLTNINSQDENGFTVLHHAFIKPSYSDKIDNIRDVVKFLLQNTQINPNITDNQGMTALHHAVIKQDSEGIELLIEKKADTNIRDLDGNIPLHYAAQKNLEDVISYRFEKLQHPEMISIVDYLILSGSDLNAINKNGKTPYDIAQENSNPKATVLLFQHPPQVGGEFIHDYFTNFYKNKNLPSQNNARAIELSSVPLGLTNSQGAIELSLSPLSLNQSQGTIRFSLNPLAYSKTNLSSVSEEKFLSLWSSQSPRRSSQPSEAHVTTEADLVTLKREDISSRRSGILNMNRANTSNAPKSEVIPEAKIPEADLVTLKRGDIPVSRRSQIRIENQMSEGVDGISMLVPEPGPARRRVLIDDGPKISGLREQQSRENEGCSIS